MVVKLGHVSKPGQSLFPNQCAAPSCSTAQQCMPDSLCTCFYCNTASGDVLKPEASRLHSAVCPGFYSGGALGPPCRLAKSPVLCHQLATMRSIMSLRDQVLQGMHWCSSCQLRCGSRVQLFGPQRAMFIQCMQTSPALVPV